MNIEEFERCQEFTFTSDNHWSVLKIFQIIISKLKYQHYPTRLNYNDIDKTYSLQFNNSVINNNINISFSKCNESLVITTTKHRITQTLKITTPVEELYKLNNFLYYRLYSNYPTTTIINEYSLPIAINDDIKIESYINKIDGINKNYLNFIQIHKSNIMLLLTWIFNQQIYSFNTVAKINNKFNFLLDDKLLMNDKKEMIDMFYNVCNIICYKESKIYNNYIKIGDIALVLYNERLIIKLHTLKIFDDNYITYLSKFKYVDDVKLQLLADYIINNNYQQKLENGFNKYIFKNIV